MITNSLNKKTEQLLEILETDAAHIEQSLGYLDRLRSLVIKRDEKSLQDLLAKLQARSDDYARIEARRVEVMKEIAQLGGIDPERIRLGSLAEILDQTWSQKLLEKRSRLRELTARLMAEHRATGLLLAECARFNGQLLTSLIRAAKTDSVTYGRDGQTTEQNQAAFMNFKM